MDQLRSELMTHFGAPLAERFHSGAFYDSTMDFLEYSKQDTVTVSEHVDGVLTLLLDARTREVIGFRLKGFRYVFKKLKPTLKLRDEQFLSLIEVIEASVLLMSESFVGDANRVAKYRLARDLAVRDGARFSALDEMEELAA